jgi:FKBP-type peptidyl-prolyl cis-trans isomerase FklB
MRYLTTVTVLACLGLATLLGGCGKDEEPDATADAPIEAPEGVVTTKSGLQYISLRQGEGRRPKEDDFVTVHYRASKADGTLIDDSRLRGEEATFKVKAALPGWKEALLLMPEGSYWRLTVPPSLAYGEKGSGDVIGPNETLLFDIDLLRVETSEEMKARRIAEFKEQEARQNTNIKYLEDNMKKENVVTLPSGLQYEVLVEGGGAKPTADDMVEVHYRGMLIDGTEFDSSYKRGSPAQFPVNGLIKGWQEALVLMNAGSKWRLVVPANLAYGDRGAGALIKPGDTLVFEIELLNVL